MTSPSAAEEGTTLAAAAGGPALAACPLCDGRRLPYAFSVDRYRLVRCADCRLLMLNPQPSAGELAEIYNPHYFLGAETPEGRERLTQLKGATARRYLRQLARYRGPAGGRLLEVGCGAGEFLAEARSEGYDVFGLEASASAAAEARRRVPEATVLAGELEAASAGLPSFDVCVLWDVLEHVRDPVRLLRTVQGLLAPDGVLALATPSLDTWSARLLRRRWVEYKPEHLFYFDRATLQTALFRAGFAGVVLQPGWKVLSLGYVARHFERYRVPLLSPLAGLARFAPAALRERPFPVVASGVLAFARKTEKRPVRRLSVIVPAYDEAPTFRELTGRLLAKEVPGLEIEVVIVESGSTDGTREMAQALAAHPRVRLVLEPRPRGKGHAVRAGLEKATGDFVLIQDADLEYDIEDYDALLEPLLQHREAFVLGSRHGGRALKMRAFTRQPILSLVLNLGHWFFAALVNVLFGQRLKDPFTMYKVFRRDCLYGLELTCDRFDFDIELLVLLVRKGYRPLEIPVNYRSRSFREGKKVRPLRDPWSWLVALARLRLRRLDLLRAVEQGRTAPG